MKAALYARVSTKDQSVDAQLDELRAYSHNRGLQIHAEFSDWGISGARARRPALDDLLACSRRRDVDAVVVTKLDRLARSVKHMCDLAAELDALGVALIVIDQAIDTPTPSGRFMFHALAAVAEFERDLIRERVSSGLRAARRRGTRLGRPKVLDSAAVRRASRLQRSGQSVREIAGVLGVSRTSVQRALAQKA